MGNGVVAVSHITCHDVELWPYSVSMLVKWVAFMKTLHWPRGVVDLGVGGVSFVELLIFMSCGLVRGGVWKRLILVIFGQGVQFQCRLFLLVEALMFGVPVVSSVL